MNLFFKIKQDERGFTLIELLVVVAILSVLAGIVATKVLDNIEKAKVSKGKSQIEIFKGALKMFKIDNGFYPSTEEGLQALVEAPANADKWQNGGYLDNISVPLDPWENPYLYISPGSFSPDFDIICLGKDNTEGGEGFDADIVSWE